MSRPLMRRHAPAQPVAVEAEAAPTDANTKTEIAEWLAARGIETTTRTTKAELLELIP